MANDKKNIEDTLKDVISKSAEVSKEVFTKAGGAVQNFSDKSVLRFEIKQLSSKRKELYAEMGEKLSTLLLEDGFNLEDSAAKKTEKIDSALKSILEMQNSINELSNLITNKEENLGKISKKQENAKKEQKK